MFQLVNDFFLNPSQAQISAYVSTYDPNLVVASVLIAVFASFCAFEMADRLTGNSKRKVWLPLVALTLGTGIWSMHFIGMLAFRLDCGVSYDPWITALSMVPGMLAAGAALRVTSRRNATPGTIIYGGLIMAGGIGLMHYSGMAAIRLNGVLRYDFVLFMASLATAVLLAIGALWAKTRITRSRVGGKPFLASLGGGVVLGAAISGMHYVGMLGAYFLPPAEGQGLQDASASPLMLAEVVGGVTLLLILGGVLLTYLSTSVTQARKQIEAIQSTSRQGFVMTSPRGLILECNAAAAALMGVPAAQLLGRPFRSLLELAPDEQLQGSYQREVRLRRADGSLVPCLVNGDEVRNEHGHLQYAFAWLQDISERVATEERLRASQQEASQLIDASPDAMVITDTQGVIQRVNEQAVALFGYTREEMVGQPVEMLVPQRYRGTHVAKREVYTMFPRRRAMGDGNLQLTAQTKANVEVPVELSLSPIETAHGVLIATTLRDATVRRQTEAMLKQARADAEMAARLKSDFLANMSHEIRTPMNAIIGLSYLMLKTSLDTRQRDYVRKIQASSQHLLGIINDILDFSKIEAGKLSVEKIEFDLHEMLENSVHLIADKAADKGLELVVDVARGVPVNLIGDPLRIGQILINYASNAVKFTEQGMITIQVLCEADNLDSVVLKFLVHDSGIGVSQEQISSLFQSFQQADTSTTRKFGGTGLGLAISKKLAELMDGQVGVISTPGTGSTFWFTVKLQHGRPGHNNFMPAPDLRHRKVLVVDDNESARKVLTEMLHSMTFDATAVASGQEAIDAVRAADQAGQPYEIAFLDWQMPVMNGVMTARAIRKLDLAKPPHCIMVTAFGRDEVRRSAEQAGIRDTLIKPVNPSVLFDTVMHTLGASEWKEQAALGLGAADHVPDMHGLRVLLVEDNEMNQIVAREVLSDAGISVDIAENGQVAVEKALSQDYHLVLMDMQMPVMDGLEATRRIRKERSSQQLPIIAMTANAMQSDRDRCIEAGMDDHLPKPIDPALLWSKLRQWGPVHIPHAQGATASQRAEPSAARTAVAVPDAVWHIPQLDVQAGLDRVLGKQGLYLNLLQKFCLDQASFETRFRAALMDDHGSAQRLAHTLKGLAGNIGAARLQSRMAELEKALATDPEYTALDAILAPALGELHTLLAALEQALPRPPVANTGAAAATVTEDAQQACNALRALLADDDPGATACLRQHEATLAAALQDGFVPLRTAVMNMDFEQALALLDQAGLCKQ